MKLAFTMLLVAHGIAHGVGFAVPWKLMSNSEVPYRTTLLGERVDVGDAGIRVIGIVWLLVGLAFVAAGAGAWLGLGGWPTLVGFVATASLVLCALGWPDAKIGVAVNALILLALALGLATD